MTDEKLKALVEKIESRPNDAPLPTEYMLDDAASAIRQLMRERDEAREVIADLSRANLERSQSPF